MTVTNNERRAVAARLRELPTDMYEVEELWETKGLDTCCKDQTDYYLIHFALFGCFPADYMHPCDYEELHMRLADLIEPEPEQTCRVVTDKNTVSQTQEVHTKYCSKCSYVFGREQHRQLLPGLDEEFVLHAVQIPDYCPNCGAKVVEE